MNAILALWAQFIVTVKTDQENETQLQKYAKDRKYFAILFKERKVFWLHCTFLFVIMKYLFSLQPLYLLTIHFNFLNIFM